LQTIAGRQRKMRRSVEHPSLRWGKCAPVSFRVNQPIPLLRTQAAHPSNRLIHHRAAIRRKQPELLIELPRPHFLVGSQVFPGFHAAEHTLLLPARQAGKVLQTVQQAILLRRREPAKLPIVFESAPLLRRRQIPVTAKPISSVPTLALRRTIIAHLARTTLPPAFVILCLGGAGLRVSSLLRLRFWI
jgi:hypothetical protein